MSRWLIDPDHTVACFIVQHMTVTDVHGQFNRISGEVVFDPAEPRKADFQAVIEAEGLYTGIAKRDAHLRSPDFFDVARFPHITCRSDAVEVEGGEIRRLRGTLTLRGVTRPVVLEVERFGPAKALDGDTSIGFRFSTKVDREEFGMLWNVPIIGGVMVSREVRIVIDLEADLAET